MESRRERSVPTVSLEVRSLTIGAAGPDAEASQWQEPFASGETLGRLLERLVVQQPAFREVYDPTTRRVARQVDLLINGRIYELVGGLTYTLHDGDRLTVSPT
jgi:hypothetical protein